MYVFYYHGNIVDLEIDDHVTKCDEICTILDGYNMNADNIRARLDHLEWQENDFLDSLNEKLARMHHLFPGLFFYVYIESPNPKNFESSIPQAPNPIN